MKTTMIYFKGEDVGLNKLHRALCNIGKYTYTIYTEKGETVQLGHILTVNIKYCPLSTFYIEAAADMITPSLDIWTEKDNYLNVTKIEIEEEK